ncbi:MAG: GNAT family N-acetyltransferase [Bdellovibrionales bacterium]
MQNTNNVLFYKDFACRKSAMKNEFTLPKSGETAKIEVLKPAHLEQALALHEATRAALPDAQKMFVLPQAPDYFKKFLNKKAGAMLGVMAGDRLVAQLVVMGPLSLEDILSNKAVTRNDVAFHHVGVMDKAAVIKSMAVHPDYRGNELSQHILAAALNLPLLRKADHAFAQISANNARSWELFLRNGFGIVGAGIDPGDNQPRFILQKPLAGFSFDFAPSADDVDPAGDFQAIIRLTQREGLIGRIDEDATLLGELRLAFSASTDISGIIPQVAERN